MKPRRSCARPVAPGSKIRSPSRGSSRFPVVAVRVKPGWIRSRPSNGHKGDPRRAGKRAGDATTGAVGQHQHQLPGHDRCQVLQERQRQHRLVAFFELGQAIEFMHGLQIRTACLVAVQDAKGHASAPHLFALGTDVLALLTGEIGQESVKVTPVAIVGPLELHVTANQPARIERGKLATSTKFTCNEERPISSTWPSIACRRRERSASPPQQRGPDTGEYGTATSHFG